MGWLLEAEDHGVPAAVRQPAEVASGPAASTRHGPGHTSSDVQTPFYQIPAPQHGTWPRPAAPLPPHPGPLPNGRDFCPDRRDDGNLLQSESDEVRNLNDIENSLRMPNDPRSDCPATFTALPRPTPSGCRGLSCPRAGGDRRR